MAYTRQVPRGPSAVVLTCAILTSLFMSATATFNTCTNFYKNANDDYTPTTCCVDTGICSTDYCIFNKLGSLETNCNTERCSGVTCVPVPGCNPANGANCLGNIACANNATICAGIQADTPTQPTQPLSIPTIAQPTQPTQPLSIPAIAQPTQPTQPLSIPAITQPTQPTQPLSIPTIAQPAQPTQPLSIPTIAQPTQPTQPLSIPAIAQPTQPTQPLSIPAITQPTQPTQPLSIPTIAQPAQPTQPLSIPTIAQPAQPTQPLSIPAITQPTQPTQPLSIPTIAQPTQPLSIPAIAQPTQPLPTLATTQPTSSSTRIPFLRDRCQGSVQAVFVNGVSRSWSWQIYGPGKFVFKITNLVLSSRPGPNYADGVVLQIVLRPGSACPSFDTFFPGRVYSIFNARQNCCPVAPLRLPNAV
ncbi:hypothetical protein QJQ45_008669 [Haematococcus lacustris]|nr:hypothetical protein QJQ45_008669 [Haematococcus lacustris]